jgi:dolichyl-phosphate beta-glucosyltransferase
MSPSPVALSLVIPAYNEASRLPETLPEVAAWMADRAPDGELLLIDDGSSDATFEVARQLAAQLPVRFQAVRLARNRGKGYALKTGFALARGEKILFSDADFSVPLRYAEAFLAALDDGADLVIGSRKTAGAEIVVAQPWLRQSLGKVFTWLTRTLVVRVSDVTCGFKAFQGDVGRDLFARLRNEDWSFDAEILYLAQQRGHRLRELPVEWHDHADTKVRVVGAAFDAFFGLLRVRWHAARGLHDQKLEVDPPAEAFSNRSEPCE